MRLILPHDEQANSAIAEWVGARLDTIICPPFYAVGISRNDDARLTGGLIFNGYNGHQIEISGYGPGAFSASVVRQLAHYVFVQLGCERLSARTRRSNATTRKLLARHFKFEGVLKRYYGDDDAILYRMFREECSWLEKKNG